MKVDTGEILSLVSLPDYDLNQRISINDNNYTNKITHGVYMEGAGRINVAGITKENVNILADAIVDVL